MKKIKLINEIKGKIKKRIKNIRNANILLLNLGYNVEYQFNCNIIKGLSVSLSIIENINNTQRDLK